MVPMPRMPFKSIDNYSSRRRSSSRSEDPKGNAALAIFLNHNPRPTVIPSSLSCVAVGVKKKDFGSHVEKAYKRQPANMDCSSIIPLCPQEEERHWLKHDDAAARLSFLIISATTVGMLAKTVLGCGTIGSVRVHGPDTVAAATNNNCLVYFRGFPCKYTLAPTTVPF